jgi:apurinic endonuclease APN1
MYFGSHISIAGGFDKCIDRIVERGGNCLMTFASSPRSLQTKEFTDADVEVYIEKKKTFKIGSHFFHGVYLVNLGTDKEDYLRASIDSLTFYQQLAGRIGGAGTIFHTGSTKLEFSKVKDQVIKALNRTLAGTPDGVKLFLENCAGQGGTIGDEFEELRELIKGLEDDSKIGVCLDTQHSFASGYDLDTVLDKFDKIVGLKYLGVIHVNDSKTDFGSRVDRHENLGEGKIGEAVLKKFLRDPRIAGIPLILEVPGSGDGPRKEDIDKLKSLL